MIMRLKNNSRRRKKMKKTDEKEGKEWIVANMDETKIISLGAFALANFNLLIQHHKDIITQLKEQKLALKEELKKEKGR